MRFAYILAPRIRVALWRNRVTTIRSIQYISLFYVQAVATHIYAACLVMSMRYLV